LSRNPRASSPRTTSGLDQTSAREEARHDRVHGAVGVIPTVLWIVLFFIAAIIFVYTLFFADSGERAVVQSLLIGSVVSVIAMLLLLLYALDNPFHPGVGGLDPVAMDRSLGWILLGFGVVLFVGTVAWIATFPISISI
jgi:membrane protease YdiL (CAAX protease family)